MTDSSTTENVELQDLHRNACDTESETNGSTKVEVDEQIRTYIPPKSKQLEELTWLIQGQTETYPSSLPPTASYSARLTANGSLPGI